MFTPLGFPILRGSVPAQCHLDLLSSSCHHWLQRQFLIEGFALDGTQINSQTPSEPFANTLGAFNRTSAILIRSRPLHFTPAASGELNPVLQSIDHFNFMLNKERLTA
jgi:hypothetical protein